MGHITVTGHMPASRQNVLVCQLNTATCLSLLALLRTSLAKTYCLPLHEISASILINNRGNEDAYPICAMSRFLIRV